jgi:filamentous hemagglutinin family protein
MKSGQKCYPKYINGCGGIMRFRLFYFFRRFFLWAMFLLTWLMCRFQANANPAGGTVTQGQATINTSGSQVNINQTSANALINWQSFNIGAGETVNFSQPSSTSVTWNQIGGANPSQILGNINANGFVVLQNPNGIYIGGSSVFNVHGLLMTTAPTPALNFSSSGPWSFAAPPPMAKIVNCGQINITGGGSAFLIAADIVNNGTINAPGGKIGLYDGENVLVSPSPDGRGLSAQVTLPEGSVDNEGNLIADGGAIAAQAQYVNQNGLVQANSVRDVNGTIELVASDSLHLGPNSTISAQGDSQAVSAGGSVTIQSGNTFSDEAGSSINVAGGAPGGNGGQVEISAPTIGEINSSVTGTAAPGFTDGILDIDPTTLVINSAYISTLSGLSQINIQTSGNIELSAIWNLASLATIGSIDLSAGNNITFDNLSGITAGQNWSVTLNAGTLITSSSQVTPGNGGIYLNGNSFLQTANGGITLNAANEIILGTGGIRTIGGGSINAIAQFGNVNTGTGIGGLNYFAPGIGTTASPYYTSFQVNGTGTSESINLNQSSLSGISTAAGGDVNITAGGNVISFSTTTVPTGTASSQIGLDPDPGTGAFGYQPGNVTINAGGSVSGNFMEMNGAGIINAGGNIGTSVGNQNVALSLVTGSWTLNAGGNIYLQEVRNPNGVFNSTTAGILHHASAGNHLFDYDPQASVALNAGNGIYLTGYNLPRPDGAVPMILPPTVSFNAGAGGVNLFTPNAVDSSGNPVGILASANIPDFTLFPSPYEDLAITTTDGGSLTSGDGNEITFLMSDSDQNRWVNTGTGVQPFSIGDDGALPPELNNNQPATLNISGSMQDIILYASKFAQITIDGDMNNCSFYGQNLQANQVTSINVGGQIFNPGSFSQVVLNQGFATLPNNDLPPNTISQWFTPLELAVDPAVLASLPSLSGLPPSQLVSYLLSHGAFLYQDLNIGGNVAYDLATQTLTAIGPLSADIANALGTQLTVLRYGPLGFPLLDSHGHFITDTITLLPNTDAPQVAVLLTASQNNIPLGINNGIYVVGGAGEFDVNAGSINLGNSDGILTVGNGKVQGRNYSFLTPYITSGATIKVTADYLEMASSVIAALGGGDVDVICTGLIPDGGGLSMDLGSPILVPFDNTIMNDNGQIGLGIYTSGGGDVNIDSYGTINVDSSRIGTFNGGNVTITSETGDVEAGSGNLSIPVNVFSSAYTYPFEPVEYAFANGIVSETLLGAAGIPGAATVPGDITINTPQGSITSNAGGIEQLSLGGNLQGNPTITLNAGTPFNGDWNSTAPPVYVGGITLSGVGAIGGTITLNATGPIIGRAFATVRLNVRSPGVGQGGPFLGIGPIVSIQTPGGGSPPPTVTIIAQQASGDANAITPPTSATTSSASQSAAQVATTSSSQQVSLNTSGIGTGDEKDKNKKPATVKVSHVSVILSAATH